MARELSASETALRESLIGVTWLGLLLTYFRQIRPDQDADALIDSVRQIYGAMVNSPAKEVPWELFEDPENSARSVPKLLLQIVDSLLAMAKK